MRPKLVLVDDDPDLRRLLDLRLRERFLVMERMRAIPELAEVPVVVVTACEGSAVRERALQEGAAGF